MKPLVAGAGPADVSDMKSCSLAVILARAGSKGLPGKNVLPLAGRPMIAHTIEAACRSSSIDAVCVTTDLPAAAEAARSLGVFVIDRPPQLATDTAPVIAAVCHAVSLYEEAHRPVTHVAILYGNVPVRPPGIIDRAVTYLIETGADSVRSLTPVEKQHPDWLHRLDGDRMVQYRKNSIDRRQDLEPLYYHDGAVVAVVRDGLDRWAGIRGLGDQGRRTAGITTQGDPHAFLGEDRRGIVSEGGPTVDVDSMDDLHIAEAIIRSRSRTLTHKQCDAEPKVFPSLGPRSPALPASWAPRIPYVIAEAGVNHHGDLSMACRLIEAAKEAGADAVKFQLFSADRLVAASTPSCAYQRSHNNGTEHQHAMLKGLELPPSAFVELKRHADRLGIDFLATPFGLPELNFLVDELDVPALKIASSDVVNVPLLTAASESGRPLIVSTGASLLQEIDQAVELIRCGGGLERLVLLHCVSSYPTRFENARLGCVGTLRERFGVAVGFSDHTVEETTGALAVMAGAVVLEKHLTLNREAQGPDHFFSLEPPMFKDYVFGIRQAATVLSDGEMGYSSEEAEVRKLARGRVVTTKPIVAGQRLTADALMVQRPGNGIPPVHWRDLIGRIARIDIPSDTPLAWSMIVSTQ